MQFSDYQENTQTKFSALSLLRPDAPSSRGSQTPTQGSEDAAHHQRAHYDNSSESSARSTALTTPTLAPASPPPGFSDRSGCEDSLTDGESEGYVAALSGQPEFSRRNTETANPSERSPLLRKASSAQYMASSGEPSCYRGIKTIRDKFTMSLSMREIGTTALHAVPAVLLGCLLNILDGVSCAFHYQTYRIFTE